MTCGGEITEYARKSRIHRVDVTYSEESFDAQTMVRVRADIRWKFPMNLVSLFLGKRMEREKNVSPG